MILLLHLLILKNMIILVMEIGVSEKFNYCLMKIYAEGID